MAKIEKVKSLALTPILPNELLSIQVIGEDVAWTEKASLSNCVLKIAPSNNEREIQLKISGI